MSGAWDAAELQKGLCDEHEVSRVLGNVREAKGEGRFVATVKALAVTLCAMGSLWKLLAEKLRDLT